MKMSKRFIRCPQCEKNYLVYAQNIPAEIPKHDCQKAVARVKGVKVLKKK